MTPHMLKELSILFSLEALEADMAGDPDEAERLWDVSGELCERRDALLQEEVPV